MWIMECLSPINNGNGVSMRYLTFLFCVFLASCAESSQVNTVNPPPSSYHVLVFTASWCSACQSDKPQIEALRKQVHVIVVDADANQDQIRKYHIRLLPTYILIKDGKEQMRTNHIHDLLRSL